MSKNFTVDRDGYAVVYTDGACPSNGRGDARAGVGVYFGEDNPYNVSRPLSGRATNNRAEIEAARLGAEQANRAGYDKVKIRTDSEFVYKSATEWMPKWEQNGWKTSDGRSVVNREDFQNMQRTMEPLDVKWEHVRGHQENRGNEMADRLARQGAGQNGRY